MLQYNFVKLYQNSCPEIIEILSTVVCIAYFLFQEMFVKMPHEFTGKNERFKVSAS